MSRSKFLDSILQHALVQTRGLRVPLQVHHHLRHVHQRLRHHLVVLAPALLRQHQGSAVRLIRLLRVPLEQQHVRAAVLRQPLLLQAPALHHHRQVRGHGVRDGRLHLLVNHVQLLRLLRANVQQPLLVLGVGGERVLDVHVPEYVLELPPDDHLQGLLASQLDGFPDLEQAPGSGQNDGVHVEAQQREVRLLYRLLQLLQIALV
mmetsp:Transcript_17535/g.33950  ORF Transcript_17535/g.33950 Transcript_17535/m.33950 type:complete len:205 (-) Transcript_17535:666-1280(-)